MMKNKLRKIRVDNQDYVWLVSPIDSSYVCLKIWLSGCKKSPWIAVKYPFLDPWMNIGWLATNPEAAKYIQPIQPKLVAQIIRTAKNDGIRTLQSLWSPQ